MSQQHDAFQNSGHDVFVQAAHTDARNALEDFVLGGFGGADTMITFTDAVLPDRTILFSAMIKRGVLSQFGKYNDLFFNDTGYPSPLAGDDSVIDNFAVYKGKLYAAGRMIYRQAIADHSAAVVAQAVYNPVIEDWDNVGLNAFVPVFGDIPTVPYCRVADDHGVLIFAGNNVDGWSNDGGATFIGTFDHAIGWDGTVFFVIMTGSMVGSNSQVNQVAKYNGSVAMYLFHSASSKFRMLQYDGGTNWSLIGDAFAAFEDDVHRIFDGVVTTIGGVKKEYLFYASGSFVSPYDFRYLNAINVWTTLTTLGIYTIDRVDEVVRYKKGVVLYGEFHETLPPEDIVMALHWFEDDDGEHVNVIGANATITADSNPSKPNDAMSLKGNDIYISDAVTQVAGPFGTNAFNGFGKYNSTNDDYDPAWAPDPAYSEYDIDDAEGQITAIGRFNVGKLKKTDPQP